MSIETTPAGTYRARWRDDTGKQRAKTFRRKQDARDFLKEVHGNLARGTYIAPTAGLTTVSDWADQWLASAHNLKRGGRETYRRDLDRYILPTLGDLPLKRLTPAAIDAYLAAELERGLAPSTVNRHYRTLHRMCAVAVARTKLAQNPCTLVEVPTVPKSEMRFLTLDQVEQLADAIAPRYRAWVLIAAYGGIRWSEGVGLQRSMVLDGDTLAIGSQLIRRADKTWDRSEPKTARGVRKVRLPATVADELGGHLDTYTGPDPGALVFPNQHGSPMNGPSFTGNVFKPALRRSGIDEGVRIHDLRHTAVALAVEAGAHPKAIQARMGHASIQVTLDRYGHLFPEMDGRVAEGLDGLRRSCV